MALDTSDEAEEYTKSEVSLSSEVLLTTDARQMRHAALEIEVNATSRLLGARSKFRYTDKWSEMVTIYPKPVKDDLSTREKYGYDTPGNKDKSQTSSVCRFPRPHAGFPARSIKSFSL